ncbi:MAG: FtsX-like permease family protein [Dehalococcoidia bacterium]
MMLALLWLKGLLLRRTGRLLGVSAGVALTVALLASLGAFIAASAASTTQRAIADVPVDWQIQLTPGTDPTAVAATVAKATAYTALQQVGYADSSGFSASSGGTVQTTGAGKVLGLSADYRRLYPSEVRSLIGPPDGVLLAQQTAANLHASPGDTVTIERPGLSPATVKVDGVVDLPNADSLFQAVGALAGSAPQAPPDNVLLLPIDQWHQLFDAQAAARPDSVHRQLHIRIGHSLPSDPGAAFSKVQGMAHNVEARSAGSGIVGDNLAARLDGARADALYARVLFLFLGLPGALLATLLTLAVAATGAERRRREQALLRTRGAATGVLLRLAGLEALVVVLGGDALGLAFAGLAVRTLGSAGGLTGASIVPWLVLAALSGSFLAVAAILIPAWFETRQATVVATRVAVRRTGKALWQRLYLDIILIAASAIAFWQTASSGYQVVLAPEGVPQASVAYEAFIAPLCLWLGAGLLAMRLWESGLLRGRGLLSVGLRPITGGLQRAVAAFLSRQRRRVARGIVLVALAFAFATSTAVFNTTYNVQSQVDARLTNGADVTVTGTTAAPAGDKLAQLSNLSGVAAAQPLQHRFAYVGNDLQDLYGIDALRIGSATTISNAYVAGGNADATLAALAARPDGLLVSAETVKDYQLNPGDQLNLRLQSLQDHQYHVVPFHFVGVVREFPTAPKDSFLIANAGYVAQQTGSGAAEVVLLRSSTSPARLAEQVRAAVGALPGVSVTEVGSTQRAISSNLTAVDLHGLTRLELSFAVLLLAAATGLILALGLVERHRTFAILTALGATGGQLRAFLWSEGLLILVGGALVGVAVGFAVAQMLVKLLTGVFDPPPQVLSIPWLYLFLLAAAAIVSTIFALLVAQYGSRRPVVEALRDV